MANCSITDEKPREGCAGCDRREAVRSTGAKRSPEQPDPVAVRRRERSERWWTATGARPKNYD